MKSKNLLFTIECVKELLLEIDCEVLSVTFLKNEYSPTYVADQLIFLSKKERKALISTIKEGVQEMKSYRGMNTIDWGEYGLYSDDFYEIMHYTKKYFKRNNIVPHWSKVSDLLALLEMQLIDNQDNDLSGIKVLKNYLKSLIITI